MRAALKTPMNQGAWKLLEILEETSRFFASKEIESPRLQAELLLANVLELRRLDLYLQFERPLHTDEVDAYRDYVRQRLQRVPVQYIVGVAAFRHLELSVTPDVLIPRPETEVLVEGITHSIVAPLFSPSSLSIFTTLPASLSAASFSRIL